MKVNINKLNESIKDSHITIEKHPTEDLYIYGYYRHPLSKTKSNWNKYSIMCRGLILNKEGKIIERAFDKFWTFRNHITEDLVLLSENKMVKLPKSKPRIYEKLDGTMGILYWINDIPYIATQRSFSGLKAAKGSEIIQQKYFEEALKLNKKYSYIFEIIYPETSLVVDYGNVEDVVLIGVIDKNTGENVQDISDFGFRVKKDLTDQFGDFHNLTEIEETNISNLEGVVLEYDNLLRIKIKFPWYKEVQKELQNIFNADYQMAESISKLRKYYNYKENILSTTSIKESINNGDGDLSKFISKLSIDQIDYGAINWAYRHRNDFLECGNMNHETFYDSLEFKDVTPDGRLWDWKKRYLDKYYD